jgi:DNA (cytosine-5)-methyltransferase 1
MTIQYGSLFSGIGGFDLGFDRAGMTCAWQCEKDAAARGVLSRRFGMPVVEDVRDVNRDSVPPVDLICGGFPCQDVSIAGKRAGLAGERSGLWFEFHRVVAELRPQWVVVENVPGLLSSNRGSDFAVILRELVECGYGVAWRILDAQYFGVAQRRRRVFVVGSLGDGRAAEVLFESESVPGNSAPRGAARPAIACTLAPGAHPGGITGREVESGLLVADTLTSHHGRLDLDSTYIFEARVARNGRGAPTAIAPPLKAQNGGTGKGDGAPLVFHAKASHHQSVNPGELSPVLDASKEAVVYYSHDHRQDSIYGTGGPANALAESRTRIMQGIDTSTGIRRLTPVECERLQGFSDGWTAGQADGTRYRQLGNAVAVPVAEWIGRRIVAANEVPA